MDDDIYFNYNAGIKIVLSKAILRNCILDGTIIGDTTPGSGKFTTLTVNDLSLIHI